LAAGLAYIQAKQMQGKKSKKKQMQGKKRLYLNKSWWYLLCRRNICSVRS